MQGTGILRLKVIEKRDFYKRDNRVIKWNKGKEKSVEIIKGSV
jgi:hypothetical protein